MPLNNNSLTLLISSSFFNDTTSLSFTAFAISLLIFKLSISSISSNIIPLLEVNKSKILSSPYFKSNLSSDIDNIISFNNLSSYGDSKLTTSDNNFSNNPSSVTVKFIMLNKTNVYGLK